MTAEILDIRTGKPRPPIRAVGIDPFATEYLARLRMAAGICAGLSQIYLGMAQACQGAADALREGDGRPCDSGDGDAA